MRSLRLTIFVALAALAVCAGPVRAQGTQEFTAPPHLGFVDGAATLDREDRSEPALSSMPIVAGDRLRTARGRAEVLFADGSALDVDEYSSVEFQAPTLLRVTSGRVLLTVAGANNPSSAATFQIDTPTASATTDGPGEYRVAVLTGSTGVQTELAVLRGSGELQTERGTMPVRAGQRSIAWDNAAPAYPQPFNSARFDAFDQWAAARRDVRLGSATSAQYLPPDLRTYGGTFDRYGAWQYEQPYGYVWYPTVAPGWRPYHNGYWDALPYYGWTWIGVDVWTWPTHHYGRWGHSRSRWFWIPDRRWAPAWVAWGAAPSYVTWCPLGFDNRPVFSLSASLGSRWNDGWVVLPRSHFGARDRFVHAYAVSPRALAVNTPFVVQTSPPIVPPRAVPRRVVGGEPATGRAVSRYGIGPPAGRAQVPSVPSAADTRPRAIERQPSAAPGPATGPFDARGRYESREWRDGFKAPLPADSPRAMRRNPNAQLPTVVLPSPSTPTVVLPSQPAAHQPAQPAPAPQNVPAWTAPRMAIPRYGPRSVEPAQAAPPAPAASSGSAGSASPPPQAAPRHERSGPPASAGTARSGDSGGGGGAATGGDGGSSGRQHDPGSRRPR